MITILLAAAMVTNINTDVLRLPELNIITSSNLVAFTTPKTEFHTIESSVPTEVRVLNENISVSSHLKPIVTESNGMFVIRFKEIKK